MSGCGVTGAGAEPVFVGVAPAAEVNAYLRGVARDEIVRFTDGASPVYSTSAGSAEVTAPTAQSFWTAQAAGVGTQDLTWRATDGAWAVVVMNAGGAHGVTAEVTAGIRAGSLLALALILLGAGALTTSGAIALVVFGVRRPRVGGGGGSGGGDVDGQARRDLAGPVPVHVAWYARQHGHDHRGVGAAGHPRADHPRADHAGAVLLVGEQLPGRLLVAAAMVCTGMCFGRPARLLPARAAQMPADSTR